MRVTDIPEAEAFILHWGEMGSHWGVNRSVSQVHALLYLSDKPLHAEEICDTLGLARSNVSTALKELQSYGIIRRTHIIGDRRDHFVAETDLWEMLMRITLERKKREIDPTLATLAELSARLEGRKDVPPHIAERIGRMHTFMGTLTGWFDDVRKLPKGTLITLMNLGGKVARFIPARKQSDS
ncbi:MarR family transcriptional regulator [Erythrobacter sp. GH3-10]|uniref:HTH-type transcriptional regulator n=1 Tax=Aurantiacibacter rhizosphaerae TaxID=2691582 RepID=A0A844XFP3_9SPHN|nr:MarR family transcriptional regulator [Aurantiacibacter rhizosphaerae]